MSTANYKAHDKMFNINHPGKVNKNHIEILLNT